MFEKFHRVEDPMTMTTGGTGLGLYIARELTRAMGGENAGAPGRDRGDDTQPPRTRARRLPDPRCRSS